MTKIKVADLKDLVRNLRDEDNYPMNAVIKVDTYDFRIWMESGLYDLEESEIEFGRACDLLDFFGIDYDLSLTENLKYINKEMASFVTSSVGEVLSSIE